MALIYTEFDTTVGELQVAIRNAILTSTDWAKINSGAAIQSSSASAAAAATSMTFVSTTGFTVGQAVRIGSGNTTEYKNLTAVTGTTITFTGQALLNAQASGTTVYPANEVLKATTTRGADMIVDLCDTAPLPHTLNMGVWRAHDGTTGTDKSARWLFYRAAAATATAWPLHVIVSASKEHLFISIEGPRANETGATSATAGSLRNYFFMDDVVPYHAGDTNPVVYAGGGMSANAGASVINNSFQGAFSRNYADTSSWPQTKLLSLDFPSLASTETVNVTRLAVADGKYYLAPYACFGDESGLRGRLANFFFAGYTLSDTPDVAISPVGQEITYDGRTFKLLAVNKSDASVVTWGQFGSAANTGTTNVFRSAIVAVPCTP